ncbi:MAG: VWA domain-containing protein, partial [Acidobacteriota bacterium]
RELTVVLVVDASASGRFGTETSTKLQMAAEISALLTFAALRNNDRVGLLLFTDEVELFLPPRKGREHGLRVLREVLAFEAKGRGTRINLALEFLQRVVTKRAVVFLVSDFFDHGYERTLRVAARKHDMVAISVTDPRESQLPAVGLVAVVDPETGQSGVIDAGSARVRRRYAELAAEARQRKRDVLRRSGVDLLELSTGEPYEPPFVRFFRERARRAMRAGA